MSAETGKHLMVREAEARIAMVSFRGRIRRKIRRISTTDQIWGKKLKKTNDLLQNKFT